MITIKYKDRQFQLRSNATFEDAAKLVQEEYKDRILLAHTLEDNNYVELFSTVELDCSVDFFTYRDEPGYQAYVRTAIFMLFKAIYELFGGATSEDIRVEFNFRGNCFLSSAGKTNIDKAFTDAVKEKMLEYVKNDLPVEKQNTPTFITRNLLQEMKMDKMVRFLDYRPDSMISYHLLSNFGLYFCGPLVPSTGYIQLFDLLPYEGGIMLVLPDRKNPLVLNEVNYKSKLFDTQYLIQRWGDDLGVQNFVDLNDIIIHGEAEQLVLMQEAVFEKVLGDVAHRIAEEKKKIILLAGPSSSGKTTTAYRLAIQLRSFGMKPTIISSDNYFIDIENRILDENGKPDFESIRAVDTEQFNTDMLKYLNNETVEIPSYNFITQKREYRGKKIVPSDNSVLIIEGIHCLNPEFSVKLPKETLFRLYVSALNPLNINDQNNMHTSDLRLMRRIIRDNATRGTNAADTIARWKDVRDGEEANIFPYQENADMVVNSAMIYEPAVIKLFVTPLLFSISPDRPEYPEARRLINILSFILPLSPERIPRTSVLREFIGDSCIDIG